MRNESRVRKILPVDLMLEKHPCLVVGSGAIAARKVGHLLAAGAPVTVVGPEASDEIRRWSAAGSIRYRARPFRASDLKGQWLVLAATDNRAVNGEVIRLCRRSRILCSAADAHWTQTDFVIPATLRRPHVTLTVSTGGESCRRARLMKDYLGRHVDALRGAELLVVSVGRSRRATARTVRELGEALHPLWGVYEFVIVNRADRIEVLAVIASQSKGLSVQVRDCVRARVPGKCRVRVGAAAVKHVADRASIKVLKAALRDSVKAGWAGVLATEWLEAGRRLVENKYFAQAVSMRLSSKSRQYQGQYESIIRSI